MYSLVIIKSHNALLKGVLVIIKSHNTSLKGVLVIIKSHNTLLNGVLVIIKSHNTLLKGVLVVVQLSNVLTTKFAIQEEHESSWIPNLYMYLKTTTDVIILYPEIVTVGQRDCLTHVDFACTKINVMCSERIKLY